MKTSIAQAFALVVYGNEALRGNMPAKDVFDHPPFAYAKSVTFQSVATYDPVSWENFAPNPHAWLAKEIERGVDRFHLGFADESAQREKEAFVGGGRRWVVEAQRGPALADMWVGREKLDRTDAQEPRIWHITYSGHLDCGVMGRAEDYGLDGIMRDLSFVLDDVEKFARDHRTRFADTFRRAARVLNGEEPSPDIPWINALPALSRDARQLLGAASVAWVFGGMGSWNDLVIGLESRAEYTRLSDLLYNATCLAIETVANSSAPEPVA